MCFKCVNTVEWRKKNELNSFYLKCECDFFSLSHASLNVFCVKLNTHSNGLLHSEHRKQFLCQTLFSAFISSILYTIFPQDLHIFSHSIVPYHMCKYFICNTNMIYILDIHRFYFSKKKSKGQRTIWFLFNRKKKNCKLSEWKSNEKLRSLAKINNAYNMKCVCVWLKEIKQTKENDEMNRSVTNDKRQNEKRKE